MFMLHLIWVAEQLESSPPEILEEFTYFDTVHDLVDAGEYATKYQVWAEIEKILLRAPIKDRRETIKYLAKKLRLALSS